MDMGIQESSAYNCWAIALEGQQKAKGLSKTRVTKLREMSTQLRRNFSQDQLPQDNLDKI